MMHELGKGNFGRVESLFKPLDYQLISAAVLELNHPGKVFVDDPIYPQTAFLFAPKMWCYLVGDPNNRSFNKSLNELLLNRECIAKNTDVLLFVCHPDELWQESLVGIFNPRIPVSMPRYHYICRGVKDDCRQKVPKNFTIHKIDYNLLQRSDVKIPDDVYEWMRELGSTADFLEKSFGFVTLHKDQVVSWCLADGIVRDCCEVGIHTVERFRRRGLGVITTTAAVDYAFSEGIREVSWQCAKSNTASVRTAEKVGFEKARSYMMYWLIFDKERNLAFLAYGALQEKNYQDAVDGYELYFKVCDDPPPWAFHDAARAWAGLRQTERAIKYLALAYENGFSAIDVTQDTPEFEYLLASDDWQSIQQLVDTSN